MSIVFNKGTVSFDQFLEELVKTAEKEGWEAFDIRKKIHLNKYEVRMIYWSGADVYETLIELKNSSND